VEKSQCLNWATQFSVLAYDGASSPNVSVRMACTFLQEIKKPDDSPRLDVVEIMRIT